MLQDLFYVEVDATHTVRTEHFLFSGIEVVSKYILSLACLLKIYHVILPLYFLLCKTNVKTILVKSCFSTKPTIEMHLVKKASVWRKYIYMRS